MADVPYLFSEPMIAALLREIHSPGAGKTMTRRAMDPQPVIVGGPFYRPHPTLEPRLWHSVGRNGLVVNIQEVRVAPGDRIWVKERHWRWGKWDTLARLGQKPKWSWEPMEDINRVAFDEKNIAPVHRKRQADLVGWWPRSSLFMPRALSRITLDVTEVRIERLQDITRTDAMAEGVEFETADPPFYWVPEITRVAVGVESGPRAAERCYGKLWDHINGPGAWDANPWVVAIRFTPRLCNVDQQEAA